jgi:hypothetical protein
VRRFIEGGSGGFIGDKKRLRVRYLVTNVLDDHLGNVERPRTLGNEPDGALCERPPNATLPERA